ncbi:MAG: hypothetical protein IJT44_06495 [Clostridia bacterium]|nr:hypothetical protein [Clostridia bacterium]
MTELETLQRAKMYIDKLANGVDPLTDQPVSDTDCINQVRISRCLFYVSDVLRKVIENGGVVGKQNKVKKIPFTISQEELKRFRFSDYPIPVSEITKRINELADLSTMTQFKYSSITKFLVQAGLLSQVQRFDGKTRKTPTASGIELGIMSEERNGAAGNYIVTLYNRAAQQFILDHMDAILEINAQKENPQPEPNC